MTLWVEDLCSWANRQPSILRVGSSMIGHNAVWGFDTKMAVFLGQEGKKERERETISGRGEIRFLKSENHSPLLSL